MVPIVPVQQPTVPTIPYPVTVTNHGVPTIVHVFISASQGVPSGINQLNQPLYPGASQSISAPVTQQCCYQVKAVYSDGHTVTVPFWNITNVPTITIHP